jgi:hypothetical protein
MKRFLLPFLLLLLFSIVFAEDYCRETTYSNTIIIFNNYDTIVHYQISATGRSSIFTELDLEEEEEDGFFLQPGDSKVIDFETYLPFIGEYGLNIIITDSKEGQTTHTYPLNTINCHTVNSTIIKEGSYCLNGGKEYELRITNTGRYNETVNVSIGTGEFTTELGFNETKNFSLIFYPKSVDDDVLTLRVTNRDIDYAKSYDFNIISCDSTTYNISEISMCEASVYEHEFYLKNEGIHADNYNITTNSQAINLNLNSLTLGPGEEQRVPFTLSTTCEDAGLKLTSVKVESELVEDLIVPITYSVDNCYDQKATVYNGVDYCESDNKTVTVELENTGTQENVYNTSLSYGPSTTNNIIRLGAGEAENITLDYNNITAETFDLIFKSSSLDACTSVYEHEETITVSQYEECYNGRLTVDETFYDNRTKITVFNNGTRSNEYLVRVWANNEIDNNTIILEAGETASFELKQLVIIHDEYGIESFKVSLTGLGTTTSTNTTYYDNRITGMIIRTAANSSLFLGMAALLFLVYSFIRKK